MQVVLQGRPETAQADVQSDKTGKPERVETVFRFPESALPATYPKWEFIIEGETIELP